jgi:glyoxylase-like metal-dependent hydrolase (beta-lactamase superfamily II)
VEVTRIDDGLWRWTTPHPDWKPGADWDEDVGCVYWEAADATVLVDPLIPTDEVERRRFLDSLDRDVERRRLPVAILLTCSWHARSCAELAERYAGRVAGASELDALPADVAAVPAPTAEEVVYWLAPARAAVPGDVLLGTEDGLTLCPASWLPSRGGLARLARDLAPLLDLPVERVLAAHGSPVLEGGRDALVSALARA